MSKVALIIIYNHQYNKNIEILEDIYEHRFSNIFHLVPFYNGKKANVFPVYENSYYFQGYIAQALKFFFNDEHMHYFFIADDLFLNPIINEENYATYMKLTTNSCFLPGFINLHEVNHFWPRVAESYHYKTEVMGVESKDQLPDIDSALKAFKKFNLELIPLRYEQIWQSPILIKNLTISGIKEVFRYLKSKLLKKKYSLPYPLICSYSDIFIVSASSIKQFCHYCGVTAATELFVEIGLPTSLVLSAEIIVTEAELDLQGKALWTDDDLNILKKFNHNLEKLKHEFPPELLYLHPIKLSKWTI